MAISLFAAGVIWRVMDQKEPSSGALNAGIGVVANRFIPPGALSDALPSTPTLTGQPRQGIMLRNPLQPGQTSRCRPDRDPAGAGAGGSEAGGRARSRRRADHRCRLARLQAGRRHAGQGRAGELGLPGVRSS